MGWSFFNKLGEQKFQQPVRGSMGGKAGPTSWSSAYKNVWGLQTEAGTHVDATTYNYGILIKSPGYYECRAGQRLNGSSDTYIGISINGDRSGLEGRTTGIWSHNHAGYANLWTESYYLGPLFAGEIVCAGAPDSTYSGRLIYANSGYAGFLSVKLIYSTT